MNVVKILLILGLGYFALTQKSEKTKNMLLVVTGLLAFCMFSLEGFTIAADQVPTIFEGDTLTAGPPQTITATGGNAPIYTVTGAITATADSITGITCKMAESDSANGTIGLASTAPTAEGAYAVPASISTIFTCAASETGPSNGEQRVGGSEADPCNCLTAVDGKNLYCNSGWMNSEILEYMDSDGKKTDNYEDAHKCWSGTLDFIPKLGDSFLGRCTKKAGSDGCTAPAAA